jgi:hypothetical protein
MSKFHILDSLELSTLLIAGSTTDKENTEIFVRDKKPKRDVNFICEFKSLHVLRNC